jgi:hypothetical protein
MSALRSTPWVARHPYPPGYGHLHRRYECATWPAMLNCLEHQPKATWALFGSVPTLYRGQACSDWALQSLWERKFYKIQRAGLENPYSIQRRPDSSAYRLALQGHLERFKAKALKAHRFLSSLSNDEWWGLGRHHGLWTPLLDWTMDPKIAAYFAFRESRALPPCSRVAVWALPLDSGCRSEYFKWGEWMHPSALRQKSQKGLFTRLESPIFVDLENYFQNHGCNRGQYPLLARIEVPAAESDTALKSLKTYGIDNEALLLSKALDPALDYLDEIARECNEGL